MMMMEFDDRKDEDNYYQDVNDYNPVTITIKDAIGWEENKTTVVKMCMNKWMK